MKVADTFALTDTRLRRTGSSPPVRVARAPQRAAEAAMTANLQTRQAAKVALNRALEVAAAPATSASHSALSRVVAAVSDTREAVKERGHG